MNKRQASKRTFTFAFPRREQTFNVKIEFFTNPPQYNNDNIANLVLVVSLEMN